MKKKPILMHRLSLFLLLCLSFVRMGTAAEKTEYVLSNASIRATWSVQAGHLSAPVIQNLASGEVLQADDELFGIALEKQQVDTDWVYLGIRLKTTGAEVVASMDGTSWNLLAKLPEVSGTPKLLRVGKMDNKGGSHDYFDLGAMGSSEFLTVQVRDSSGKLQTLTGNPARIHRSKNPGTELAIHNEHGTVRAAANSTAFAEYAVSKDGRFFSCRIKKGSDQGQTWSPGLALIFEEGGFIGLSVRAKDLYNVLSAEGEQIVRFKVTRGLQCGLSSKAFVCGAVKQTTTAKGQVLQAQLLNRRTGLAVLWRAELRAGSNYIRQELTFAGKKKIELYGLHLLGFKTTTARQKGQVPGSPVITDSFFTGIEMPVTVNEMTADGFRSGFGCDLPLEPSTRYRFGSVVGVYPKGQVRRAFNAYLERERATPSFPFLHYNCWYDFAPDEEQFVATIRAYEKELTKKRGITLNAFVMDDGWDDFNAGLWVFNQKHFPDGFTKVARAARKAGSRLGVWISPLGGYGGANERTAFAKKMGLIQDQLDLSQPAYYQWFRDKCLGMMREYGVNYFKWDKAGSGVDPHFMALLRVAEELKKENPKLYLNVTVGTWPSPFWLNHIDCTWRDGSADVAWYGKGDQREKWLTFRDLYCYRLVVQRAPLYPINSLMHHGLVLGHHYQGKNVAEAGANLKHAARSYFGSGPNLQELYLSPDLMTPEAWDQLAEAIHWNQKNQAVLVDTHWIGGDPSKLEIYGWAAWKKGRGTLTLRNPNDQPQTISLDIAQAFELPPTAAQTWQLKNAYRDQTYSAPLLRAGQKQTFTLQPFDVLVFDARPVR